MQKYNPHINVDSSHITNRDRGDLNFPDFMSLDNYENKSA